MDPIINRPTVDFTPTLQDPAPVLAPAPVPEIPKSRFDLKSIKGFTEKKKALKVLRLQQNAIEELSKSFDIFDKSELHLNHTLVLFTCQIVEDLFCKKQQGKFKEEVVLEVCKPYFNGDPELVRMVIELVFERVTKTTMWRRNVSRIKEWGIFFGKMIFPNIQQNLSVKLRL
jgi:hypothetical protein